MNAEHPQQSLIERFSLNYIGARTPSLKEALPGGAFERLKEACATNEATARAVMHIFFQEGHIGVEGLGSAVVHADAWAEELGIPLSVRKAAWEEVYEKARG